MKILTGKNQNGFTLIEIIVAMSLFVAVVMSIMAIYLSILRLDRRIRGERVLAQNGRFIYEFLEKEITNGRIDYNKTPCGASTPANEIYLVNQSNESEHIYLSDGDLILCKGGLTTNLNSDQTQVNGSLLLFPSADPYLKANSLNVHPRVTVVLEFITAMGTSDEQKLNLQNTFSPLYYPPRQ